MAGCAEYTYDTCTKRIQWQLLVYLKRCCSIQGHPLLKVAPQEQDSGYLPWQPYRSARLLSEQPIRSLLDSIMYATRKAIQTTPELV